MTKMVLNKQKGNMYGFVTHTWNPIKGKCSHDCDYCYMKIFKQNPIRYVEKELKDDLGYNNFIFVGSSTDMFADDVPDEWILKVLNKCCEHSLNKYLFQTKNPKRFKIFKNQFPEGSLLGITLESNRNYDIDNAPYKMNRIRDFALLEWKQKMVSIEPILKYDAMPFIYWLQDLEPKFVSVGADSKGHKLQEPTKEEVQFLIKELKKFTKVIEKDNLKRLIL